MVQQNSSQKETAIRCSKKLTSFLKRNAVYGESLEDVIWRKIAHAVLTRDDKKDMKEAGYEKYI